MILKLHIFIIASLLSCHLAQHLIDRFMPRIRHRLAYAFQSNPINQNFIPLYMKAGPNPVSDYMGNPFGPRNLVKRFHRIKRQLQEEDRQYQDLLDSFGGNTDPTSDVSTKAVTTNEPLSEEVEISKEEVETSTPKSGFYFLLDWNSFFILDDQNGKKVNIRIQPKVGDPKRFFSVTVP